MLFLTSLRWHPWIGVFRLCGATLESNSHTSANPYGSSLPASFGSMSMAFAVSSRIPGTSPRIGFVTSVSTSSPHLDQAVSSSQRRVSQTLPPMLYWSNGLETQPVQSCPKRPPTHTPQALLQVLHLLALAYVLSPWFLPNQPFYTVPLLTQTLSILSLATMFRSLSFLATSLPGPAPHCAPNELRAWGHPPKHWYGYLIYGSALGSAKEQMERGCGDLIFSSHMT